MGRAGGGRPPWARQGPQLPGIGYGRRGSAGAAASEHADVDGVASPCVIPLTSSPGRGGVAGSMFARFPEERSHGENG